MIMKAVRDLTVQECCTKTTEMLRQNGFEVGDFHYAFEDPYVGNAHRANISYRGDQFRLSLVTSVPHQFKLILKQSFPCEAPYVTFPSSLPTPSHVNCDYGVDDLPQMRSALEAFGSKHVDAHEISYSDMSFLQAWDSEYCNVVVIYHFKNASPGKACSLEADSGSPEWVFTHHIWQESQGHYCINAEKFPLLPIKIKLEGVNSLDLTMNFRTLDSQRAREIIEGLPLPRNFWMQYDSSLLKFNKTYDKRLIAPNGITAILEIEMPSGETFTDPFRAYREIYRSFTDAGDN